MSTDFGNEGLTRRSMIAAAALAAPALAARAETYPVRSIRLVVPFPAGGPADALARLAAERAGARLGQPVVIDNRAGAGGNIAGQHVATGEADGYTLLEAGQAILAINKALYKSLAYDPAKDFSFVGMLGVAPNVLLVNPSAVPATSVAELLALAKAKPGQLSYASNGPGSLVHLTMAILAQKAGVDLLHVPYQGAAALTTDLLAGRIGMTLTGASSALPLVQSGKLRALAVTTGKRSRFSPELPTLVESGFPDLDAPTWFAAMVRASTPAPILERLRSDFAAVISSTEYATALERIFVEVDPLPAADGDAFLARERALWSGAVKLAGTSID